MHATGPDKKRLMEGIDIIVDEARTTAREALRRSGAESLGENLKQTVQEALSSRESVVMLRLNKESVARVGELVEVGVVASRSESVAFLIGEGIKARGDLFDRIASKVDDIRKAREELRKLLDENGGASSGIDSGASQRASQGMEPDNKPVDDWDEDSEVGRDDRSPNDDRSDSMNPNNDAYQAALDNRSDQMNPNNSAYHSSRGR